MKYKLLVLCMALQPVLLAAQSSEVLEYSPYKSAAAFAAYSYKKYNTNYDRFSFVYDWICNNIKYDTDSALFFNWSAPYEKKIEATLQRRKGVCENYASLLTDIATRMHIPAYVVHGFPVKRTGSVDDSHAWVAVKIDEKWLLCDPTWDAANNDKRKYFLSSPQSFIETHIPFDPMWQLLERPLYYKISEKDRFNYQDSITAFFQLDSLQRLLSTQQRINNSSIRNNMSNNWERLNKMNIAIIAGEQDEKWYNDAVKAYNDGLRLYNDFIKFRNNGFSPTISDEKISAMLSPITGFLKAARENINKLGNIRENFQYDPSQLSLQIDQLHLKTKQQQQFLTRYFAADAAGKNHLLISGN